MFASQKNPSPAARRRFFFEALEDRRQMAVTLTMDAAGTLFVRGDSDPNNITVYKSGLNTMVQSTTIGGVSTIYNMGTKVTKLDISTFDGPDTLTHNTNLRATLDGGPNDDILSGGSATDYLLGGYGNDRMFGGPGTDYLLGGPGADFLDAGGSTETAIDGGDDYDINPYKTVVGGAVPSDIKQGITGNCFILSPLGEAAQHGVDMASRIVYIGNATFEVSLFQKNANGTYSPTKVIVNYDGTRKYTDPAPHFRNQEGEFWPLIMNRALAKLFNLDLYTVTRGESAPVYGAIFGRVPSEATWYDAAGNTQFSNDPYLDQLYAVGNSRPTIAWTTGAAATDTSLFSSSHVYMIHSVTLSGYLQSPATRQMVPQYIVVLYNPHGVDNQDFGLAGERASGDNNDGLIAITGSEFKRSFRGFAYN